MPLRGKQNATVLRGHSVRGTGVVWRHGIGLAGIGVGMVLHAIQEAKNLSLNSVNFRLQQSLTCAFINIEPTEINS